MRTVTALTIAICLGRACMAETSGETPPDAGKETEMLRARTMDIYNGAFNRNLLKEPREAEADFSEVQNKLEMVNPNDLRDPAIGNTLFQRGYLSVEAGDYKKAIELFEELVRRFPEHAYADDALYQVGFVYQRHLKDHDRAAEAYTRLAKSYRDRENAPVAQYQNAQIAAQTGNIADANTFLNDARDNANWQRRRRGQKAVPNYYEQQSDDMIMFGDLNATSAAETELVALYFQGANDLQEGRLRDAMSNFGKIQKEYGKSKLADDAAFGLAECSRLAGKFDEAARAYEEFLKKHPRSELVPQATFRLAEFKRLAGNEKEARRLYESVIAGTDKEKDLPTELRRMRGLATRRLEELGAPVPPPGR